MKNKKFIKDYCEFLEKTIDWNLLYPNIKRCNYCNKEIINLDISEFKFINSAHLNSIKFFHLKIIHFDECLIENNININNNIQK